LPEWECLAQTQVQEADRSTQLLQESRSAGIQEGQQLPIPFGLRKLSVVLELVGFVLIVIPFLWNANLLFPFIGTCKIVSLLCDVTEKAEHCQTMILNNRKVALSDRIASTIERDNYADGLLSMIF
jgi:hypothetical protein